MSYLNFVRGLLCILLISSATNAVTIDMVTVGNPGNAPDTRYNNISVGSVDHVYQIGKYEVTAGQYTEFLNAVADADPNGLYNPAIGSIPSIGANIQRTGSSPTYSYTVAADWADRPVNYMSFWDAVRFANWLHNGQPTGAQGPGTTEDGAYLNVGNQSTFARQPGALFFIPTEDEWYKAAYHNKAAGLAASYFNYPTGTNVYTGRDMTEATLPGSNANYYSGGYLIDSPYFRTPVGEFELSDSPYGTFDQGGNIFEWNETVLNNVLQGTRGGSFFNLPEFMHADSRYYSGPPLGDGYAMGFRVASTIPEPSTLLLLCFGSLAVLWRRRLVCASILAAVVCAATSAQAVTIDMVTVGNPGNAGEVQSQGTFGAIGYNYRIGKTEVTNAQYVEFLNGVDSIGANALALYDSTMSSDANGGINFNGGAANGLKYEIKPGRDNNPVVFVSWYDSIRFANWLHNGQGAGDTENGAYTLGALGAGGVPTDGNSITRNAGAIWWLPSEDEWYKSAYHKNDGVTGNYWDYPTSTDAVPYSDQPPGSDAPDQSNTANFFKPDSIANGYNDGFAVTGSTSSVNSQNYLTDVGAYAISVSAYGTFDQGGNVWEWNETLISGSGGLGRGIRGGSWAISLPSIGLEASNRGLTNPTNQLNVYGFRIASNIPEPSTLLLLCVGSLAVLWRRRCLVCASILAVAVGISFTDAAMADTFGSGANTFDIDFVSIGNPGNAADITGSPNPAGSVSYLYRIGEFEVSREMVTKANSDGGLGITLQDMTSFGGNGVNRPATGVSWNEAARFVNWLNTSRGFTPAYKFTTQPGDGSYSSNQDISLWVLGDDGFNAVNPFRNSNAYYFLPNFDEWYKAAYCDPIGGVYYDYPTSSDSPPMAVASGTSTGTAVFGQSLATGPADIMFAGGRSPYGTMGQGGNVFEWQETEADLVNGPTSSTRGLRGGSWANDSAFLMASNWAVDSPRGGGGNYGFRIASNIPEPSTLLLLCVGSLAVLWRRRAIR